MYQGCGAQEMAKAANYLSRTVHGRLYGAALVIASLLLIAYYHHFPLTTRQQVPRLSPATIRVCL